MLLYNFPKYQICEIKKHLINAINYNEYDVLVFDTLFPKNYYHGILAKKFIYRNMNWAHIFTGWTIMANRFSSNYGHIFYTFILIISTF